MIRQRPLASLARGTAVVVAAVCLVGCASTPKTLDPRNPHFQPLVFSPPEPSQSRLSGGAPVFLLPDHTVPLVRIYVAFRGGSVYDPADKAGLAQVTGLAWRTGGTNALEPEKLDEELESRGIELKLGLGRDKGWATLSVLPADLGRGLEILSQLLMTPSFVQMRVAWARSQVSEGIRREGDDPDTLAFRELRRALYRGHPRGLIPTLETVGRVTREDVVDLHGRLLAESSWCIGAVGDFEPGSLLGELESLIGRLPGHGSGFPVLSRPPEPLPRLILVPRSLAQSTLVAAWLGPDRLSKEFYPLELSNQILGGGGFQSRLVREIRSNRGLAYSVGSFYEAFPEFGILGVHASTKQESTAEVAGLLESLPAQAASGGFSSAEVDRARESLENRHVFRYDDPADLVREELSLVLDGLPVDLPRAYVPGLSAATAEQVSAAAMAHYGKGDGVRVIVGNVRPEDAAWSHGRPVEVILQP